MSEVIKIAGYGEYIPPKGVVSGMLTDFPHHILGKGREEFLRACRALDH